MKRNEPRSFLRVLGNAGAVDISRPPRKKASSSAIGTFFPRSTRVLGLDLAAVTTGWAVLQDAQLVAAGSIKLAEHPNRGETRPAFLARRAGVLFVDLKGLVDEYRPAIIAYEFPDQTRPGWSGGTKGREFVVARALGGAEMSLVIGAANLGVTLVAVPASAAKRRVAGSPGATKGRIRLKIAPLIGHGTVEQMTDDQSDAVSICLAVLEDWA